MTAALEGVSGQRHAPAYFTPGKTRYPLYSKLGGPQGRSGRAENLAPPAFDPRTVQAVAQSLYRQSYPAHCDLEVPRLNIRCKIAILIFLLVSSSISRKITGFR